MEAWLSWPGRRQVLQAHRKQGGATSAAKQSGCVLETRRLSGSGRRARCRRPSRISEGHGRPGRRRSADRPASPPCLPRFHRRDPRPPDGRRGAAPPAPSARARRRLCRQTDPGGARSTRSTRVRHPHARTGRRGLGRVRAAVSARMAGIPPRRLRRQAGSAHGDCASTLPTLGRPSGRRRGRRRHLHRPEAAAFDVTDLALAADRCAARGSFRPPRQALSRRC